MRRVVFLAPPSEGENLYFGQIVNVMQHTEMNLFPGSCRSFLRKGVFKDWLPETMFKKSVSLSQFVRMLVKLDIVNCARLRRPYGGLGGSVWVMGEWSVGQ